MSKNHLNENYSFDDQDFTFTDYLIMQGIDKEMWDSLSEEEKQEYINEFEEDVQAARETLKYEGGLYEGIKLNQARKRFQQINEYILNMNGETNEAQENNDAQEQTPDMGMGQPPMDNTQQQPNSQQTMNNQQPQMGGGEEIPQGDNAQGMPPQDNTLDPTIGAEADENGNNIPDNMEDGIIEPEVEGEEDEVIDVDDLTQSQETTEYKLDGVDDKLSQLIDIVGKFAQAIDDNDEKIEDLKREIAERNPSQQERLNIRSMSGSPYTVSPQDYWSDQNARNPQYNVIADNDVDPDKEEDLYTITDDDIKNFNKDEIEKSINDIPVNLKDYF